MVDDKDGLTEAANNGAEKFVDDIIKGIYGYDAVNIECLKKIIREAFVDGFVNGVEYTLNRLDK